MKTAVVRSEWLHRDGRRFDAGPFTSGAVETRLRLASLKARKDRLADLTTGYEGGIYNGPQFARHWVEDPEYGVPFLGSSSMLQADLSELPLLRRRDAESPKLSYLRISPGTTLISCSGTIGRMVYTRPDMDGMWTSQHVMKVVPHPERVPPGYLYAFLSSRYGVPLVTASTYGAIIQHIEPHHLADLPIPRLGHEVESQAHRLMERVASLRTEANERLRAAITTVLESWRIIDLASTPSSHPEIRTVQAAELASHSRFDAAYYGVAASSSDSIIEQMTDRVPVRPLSELADDIFETPRFGRLTVQDPRYGTPFLSISDLVRTDPRTDTLVSRKQVARVRAEVRHGWLILPRVGQIQGVFGTVCYIPAQLDGAAVSDNNIRIVPKDEASGAYLWAALSTRLLYAQIVRRACGTSIP